MCVCVLAYMESALCLITYPEHGQRSHVSTRGVWRWRSRRRRSFSQDKQRGDAAEASTVQISWTNNYIHISRVCIYKTRHKCVNYRISTLCDRCKISTKLHSNNNNNNTSNNSNNNCSETTFVLFFELGFEFPSCRWVRSLFVVEFALAELAALPPTPRAVEYQLYIYKTYIYLHTISIYR